MKTWIAVSEDSDFSIYNIPFGVFSIGDGSPRLASRISDKVIDLKAVAKLGVFDDLNIKTAIWDADFLNDFISLGKSITNQVRLILQKELCDENSVLKSNQEVFIDVNTVKMHLTVRVGDYTDFYSSI